MTDRVTTSRGICHNRCGSCEWGDLPRNNRSDSVQNLFYDD
jgi:hypothetical protein